MPLNKTIKIAAIGVPASHHVIRRYAVDLQAKITTIDVASFYDAAAAAEGAQSIGMASVHLNELPTTKGDVISYLERLLAASAPDGSDDTQPDPMNSNRYLFAGAQLVP
jgi:hypothetical protein